LTSLGEVLRLSSISRVLVAAVFFVLSASTFGQNARPTQTTATFGNWVLRCLITPSAPPSKACEIYQQVQAVKDGQQITLLTIAVGRGQPTLPLRVTVALPVDVLLGTGVKARFSESLVTEMTFDRCLGNACYASANASDDFLKAMRGPADGVRIEFKAALGADLAVPISLEGFSEAVNALREEESRRQP
jgi:invasion protein IalB